MESIFSTLLKDKSVKQIANFIANKKDIKINGLVDALKTAIFAACIKDKSMMIITDEKRSLDNWHNDLKLALPNTQIKTLPELDFFNVDAAAKSLDLYAKRIDILNKLICGDKIVVLASAGAVINPVVSPESFQKAQLNINVDDTFDRDKLIAKLVEFGYLRDGEVDSIGHFAIRGGIVDIFPVNAPSPVRIEFFDNVVDSIRFFDIDSKRSTKRIDKIVILPVNLIVNDIDSSSVIEYLNDGVVIFDEPIQIIESINKIAVENPNSNILSFDSIVNTDNAKIFLTNIAQNIDGIEVSNIIDFDSNKILLKPDIKRWLGAKFSHTHKSISTPVKKSAMDFFSDISIGDYVVHSSHGIGKFLGVVSMEVGGSVRDYVHIQYSGKDKVFLPTDQLHYVQKYIAVGDSMPHLSRLNSADWSRAKSKAKAAVEDIAEKLIDIYARRRDSDGFAFAPDDALQTEFEDACEFELTNDQVQTLKEVKSDMEKQRPMDRLICGDVGFGKTEIAIRAAFKAAMNGKQVALLVPTTVLAYQHYLTFTKRFEKFLPSVDLLSRFRTSSEQADTLKRLKNGQLDILIGTHSILNSNKVKFKDLGLLIIDEEQRFGVKQKDKFRDLASGVDVLSLSATPIPRSLHMSMIGARDLSVIETAPAERFPVQTYVVESSDEIIISAIKRELNRYGQVFFIYNRIETIDKMRDNLQSLIPEAKIMTAHGQMAPELLEQIMMDFYNCKFDILLSTSIVENGLDVSNANTLIVYNADYFGLSQLYQLKGRVGRSSRLAFAYFMFKPDKILTEAAEKRLQAIKDFAQLGSSFNIALRDLQIRGAGNLLGAQQHGHIAGVGFAMYCQLLQDAIAKLRNKKTSAESKVTEIETDESTEVFMPTLTFKVNAFFDDEFIPNSHTKLLFYQRLANLDTVESITDFSAEIKDRFGKLPKSAENLIDLTLIKIYAVMLHISAICERDGQIIFQFAPDSTLKNGALQQLIKSYKQNIIPILNQRIIKLNITPSIKKNLLSVVIQILKTLQ